MTTEALRVTVAREVARAVTFELNRADRTKKWLSERSGIPYSTLSRKLAADAQFNFAELAIIANALGIEPVQLTPAVFGGAVGRAA